MSEGSICFACATALGGESFKSTVGIWVGCCDICEKQKPCAAYRDYKWPKNEYPNVEKAKAKLGKGVNV